MRSNASSPDISGRRTSSITASGGWDRRSIPWPAFAAVTTSSVVGVQALLERILQVRLVVDDQQAGHVCLRTGGDVDRPCNVPYPNDEGTILTSRNRSGVAAKDSNETPNSPWILCNPRHDAANPLLSPVVRIDGFGDLCLFPPFH